MSDFQAVFLEADESKEREIEFRILLAGTLSEASAEAFNLNAPEGVSLIKVLADGFVVNRIGIGA